MRLQSVTKKKKPLFRHEKKGLGTFTRPFVTAPYNEGANQEEDERKPHK